MNIPFQTLQWNGKQAHSPYLKQSLLQKFIKWADVQQFNRLLWLAVAFFVQGCVLTPVALMAPLMANAGFVPVIAAMFSILSVVIVNLAALPTKITIPVFFASAAIDLIVIAYSLMTVL